ncbi:YoaK family protein [Streptomyces sp. NPDC047985]|uniref:YoaK family protein n=1 Tax=Streptomyces sp. NPDC047985 TaxID=3155384 RepID=UPI00341D9008
MSTVSFPTGRDPRTEWTLLLLSAASGAADAFAFVCVGQVFAGVMTGNLVLLGASAVGVGEHGVALKVITALASYGFGVASGAWLSSWLRWHLPMTLLVEVVLLTTGAALWGPGPITSEADRLGLLVLVSAAMGVQGRVLTTPTNYFTGTLTSLVGRGLADVATGGPMGGRPAGGGRDGRRRDRAGGPVPAGGGGRGGGGARGLRAADRGASAAVLRALMPRPSRPARHARLALSVTSAFVDQVDHGVGRAHAALSVRRAGSWSWPPSATLHRWARWGRRVVRALGPGGSGAGRFAAREGVSGLPETLTNIAGPGGIGGFRPGRSRGGRVARPPYR